MSFVHLHVHSEYSLLDGLSKVTALVQAAKAADMPALALTDHGALFGAVEFYIAAKKAKIKPILGMEAYLVPDVKKKNPKLDRSPYHLLLLAQNERGWKNLMKLASFAQLEGFYYKPRIDYETLARYADGLIATTGCLSAEVPVALKRGDMDKARERLDWYYEVFGPERFFFELQDHNIPELREVNKALLELGKRYNARFVATNDVHYIRPEDAKLQDVLIAIQTGKKLKDPKRLRMEDPTYYFRSAEEMRRLFGEVPGAVENTLLIAEMCDVHIPVNSLRPDGVDPEYFLPTFPVPEGLDAQSYLRQLAEEGLRRRYGDRADDPEVRARFEHELDTIHDMDFDAYFLIVWDLVNFARQQGIWYNARGSAAGSLVAYCLGITMVDPLEHDLIFERFLNRSRQTMPDIDLDFQDDRRDEMLRYIADKYGAENVAQIITYGSMKARAALRDVGRVLEIDPDKVDRLAKQVPNIPSRPVNLRQVLFGFFKTVKESDDGPEREVPDEEKNREYKVPVQELVQAYQQDPETRRLFDTAMALEGVVRHVGTHAAGVVVTPDPVVEHVPLHRPTSGGGSADDERGPVAEAPIRSVTQFEMGILEDMGLLKVDFLGLATLTVMARACDLIAQRHGKRYDLYNIPLDDPAAYELMRQGDTVGLFQVEGAGFTRHLVNMQPTELKHIVAMVALYRPGPMAFIDSFIRRMHGEEEITYRHPRLEPILAETYGITVYQEQIMRAAMDLAGYSGVEADNLRRAIAKKKQKDIEEHEKKFVEGAVQNGIPRETAQAIFNDWKRFAQYGFNKSHAADYAVIAVQTAFLKAHYRLEYMTALLTVVLNNTDKVARYVEDARQHGLTVLPPDINHSRWEFTIEALEDGGEGIRFGLGAIKHVSHKGVQEILRARDQGGPFADLADFVQRVDLRVVGRRSLESLIKAGALDRFGDRAALLEALDRIMTVNARAMRDREAGQLSLFGGGPGGNPTAAPAAVIDIPLPDTEATPKEKLAWEQELMGVFFSEHPLAVALKRWPQLQATTTRQAAQEAPGRKVNLLGVVRAVRPYTTKKGQEMAFVTLEDLEGQIDLVVFPKVWRQVRQLLREGEVVWVQGKTDQRAGRDELSVLVDRVETDLDAVATRQQALPLEDAFGAAPGGLQEPEADYDPWADDAFAEAWAPTNGNGKTRRAPARRFVLRLHLGDDEQAEIRRLRRVYEALLAFPGDDACALHLHWRGRVWEVTFPQLRTHWGPELEMHLRGFLRAGEDWFQVSAAAEA